MSANRRHERVRELLKRAIGEAVRREFSMEDVGLISVNDVGVAGDLHSALVYIGIVGGPHQQKRAMEILSKHSTRIQSLVARSVVLKYMPRLKFTLDESVERGGRVLRIMEEIDKELPPETDSEPE